MRSDSSDKRFGPIPALILLAGVLFAAGLGCKAKTPAVSAFPPPAAAADHSLVCDFESPTPTGINPDLFDKDNPPTYRIPNPGEVSHWGSSTVTLLFGGVTVGGAAGTDFSYHCEGTLTDYGDDAYPAITLRARFRLDGSVYDMGAFTGVKYYLKVGSGDTAGERALQIPLTSTVPVTVTGGTCLADCWDHFHAGYGTTGGLWTPVVVAFTDFTRAGYGSPLDPPNLTGANLQQAFDLEWKESNENTPGTIDFDFSVDEISFY